MKENQTLANHEKELGNKAFQAKHFETALNHYERALQAASSADFSLRSKICSNISLAHFHLNHFQDALQYINSCLDYYPKLPENERNLKTYCRKATILCKLKSFNEALLTLNEASKLFKGEDDRRVIEKVLKNITKFTSVRKKKNTTVPSEYDIQLQKIVEVISFSDVSEKNSKAFENMFRPISFRKTVYGDDKKFPDYLPQSLQDFFKKEDFVDFQEAVVPKVMEQYKINLDGILNRAKSQGESVSRDARKLLEKKVLRDCIAVVTKAFFQSVSKHLLMKTIKTDGALAVLSDTGEESDILLDQVSTDKIVNFSSDTAYFITEPDFLMDTDKYWMKLLRGEIYQAFDKLKSGVRKDDNVFNIMMDFSIKKIKETYQGLFEMSTNFSYLPYQLNKDSKNSLKLCKPTGNMLLLRLIQNEDTILFSDNDYFQCEQVTDIESNKVYFDSGRGDKDTGVKVSCIYFVNPEDIQLTILLKLNDSNQIIEQEISNDTLLLFKSREVSFSVRSAKYQASYVPIMMIGGFFYGSA